MIRLLRLALLLSTFGGMTIHASAIAVPAPPPDIAPSALVPVQDDGETVDGEVEGAALFPEPFIFPRIPVVFPPGADAPGLTDFLNRLRGIAEKRDTAALMALVAPKIFWDRDFGGGFDENQSGQVNFQQAMQIGIPDILPEYADDGWKRLIGLLATGRLSTEADFPGAYCTPVFPTLADEAAAKTTFAEINMDDGSWQLNWFYVDSRADALDRPGPEGKALVTVENEALPLYNWGVEGKPDWVEIGLPDGRHAFLQMGQAGSWVNERLCFGRTGDAWSITGYVGGGD